MMTSSRLDHSSRQSPRFIVTTSKSILVVEPLSHRIQRVHSGRGLYYGIDVSRPDVLVAARHRMVSSTISPADERGQILVFDLEMQFIRSIQSPFPLRDLHQIRRIGDKLFATCSFDNMVAVFHDNIWAKWWPLGSSSSTSLDVNHFNTIECIGDWLCLLAHNQTRPSEILIFDKHTLKMHERLTLGAQAHNIWKQSGEWCVCDSANGRLLGITGFEVVTGGFPRGIFLGADFTLVGISEIAERSDRDFANAEIAVYDNQWQKIDSIPIVNEGLVLDIALLPSPNE